ncbi:MAG: hypothetical protein CVV64_20520 [Candidatus Wallbacteria bacterium HGW-Wallbacteria-1]|jgi:hypothetical protein|uniref:Uncharacterized protein n=1 Tax=Candidatus Wallbacteria bacterium HGW-Wallbacteria-1 TaxID=2013854 RepID=A0A2N1PI63_9BACT|nr:MAG: hypothetical protein CVV64_20520 [Candidatus Wallbacteria bacterium HGW-Wallbacteria-1]
MVFLNRVQCNSQQLTGKENGMNICGVNSGINRLEMAASKIARNQGDMVSNMVQLPIAKTEVAANVRVIKAQSEMLGTLLDIRA